MSATGPKRQPRIFTIGHSDFSLEKFFKLLEASSIKLVADVRTNPVSVRSPHYERHALALELEQIGLAYRWFRALGGRRRPSEADDVHTALADPAFRAYATAMNTADFTQAALDLVGLAASTVVVALCAERDYRHCHRLLLADKLTLQGARVVHILSQDEAEEHLLHPDLDASADMLVYRARQLDLELSPK